MKTLMIVAAAMSGMVAPAALAQSLTGTWKGDVASMQLQEKPDVFAVKNGTFSCSTCIPAVTVPADGAYHKVAGHPYWDEIKVQVMSPTTLAYSYRAKGQEMSSSTDTVSADGKTLTSTSHSNPASNAAGTATDYKSTQVRVGPVPAGAHAASGTWKTSKLDTPSNDAPLTITIADSGKRLMLRSGTGETYDAAYGGPAVPVEGDRGHTMVTVRRINATTVDEADTRGGKLVATYRYVLQPGGRTIRMTYTDKRNGNVNMVNLIKQ